MQNADTALFHVKDNNKGGYTFFDAGMREKTLRYIRLHDQIISALQNGEFLLYYQPQIDISSGRISGAEALIRWRKPDEGIVLPMEFIPFAEKTGQITRIGEWVLSEVCRQMDLWKNTLGHDVQVSVNISGADLLHDSLIDFVRKAMADFDIDGHNIILEITETAFLTDLGKALSTLRLLKEMGITIALDDFGTGYSSLTYLQKLPIDILKVDRSFIKNMLESADSSHIFKLIVELAHKLGLKVVAEGVETKEQLDYLTANDCDIVQGFYIGRPVPPDEIETMFRRQSAV
jgi:EAL domain-containing protein (putative c-di-GMP-specific phosphodiesterase class I)